METLRNEIVESQKARSDLLKWKLVLVAFLGGAGLGLQGKELKNAHLLLCLIPFVCIYIDLLCRHINLRIKVIGEFLKRAKPVDSSGEFIKQYEQFCSSIPDVFSLESWALHFSSIALSAFVFFLGISIESKKVYLSIWCIFLFIVSSALGILLAIGTKLSYEHKLVQLEMHASKKLGSDPTSG